jgi:hypothetical protein
LFQYLNTGIVVRVRVLNKKQEQEKGRSKRRTEKKENSMRRKE